MELDLESGETRALFETAGKGYGSFELSPDGRYLAAVKNDRGAEKSSIVILTVAGGKETELFSLNQPELFEAYGSMSWIPDSQALVVVKVRQNTGDPHGMEGPKELWLVSVRDGEAGKLDVNIDAWNLDGIRLHPNGDRIAFSTGSHSREVWTFENLLSTQTASR